MANLTKFSILMFGPAYGHNIKPFLQYFQDNTAEYTLTFVYSGRNDFAISNEFEQIQFVKIDKNIKSLVLLYKTLQKKHHLIWHHGAYNLIELLLISLFKRKESYFNINIWGERIPQLANSKNLRGLIYRKIFRNANKIQLNWYGTQKLMEKIVPTEQTAVFAWGLDKAYFQTEKKTIYSPFTQKFIAQLPQDKFKFFYPKSISTASDHLSLIEACKLLKEQNTKPFIVYFWLGNVNNKQLEQKYIQAIENHQLQKYIQIVKHPFLPFEDIVAIWKKMNAGLQIAINDQFSTTVLEPLLFEKELIITDIFPYQKLNEIYPELNLALCSRNAKAIANQMKKIISTTPSDKNELLQNRKQIVLKHFVFEKNLNKMLTYYKAQIGFQE